MQERKSAQINLLGPQQNTTIMATINASTTNPNTVPPMKTLKLICASLRTVDFPKNKNNVVTDWRGIRMRENKRPR